MAKLFLLHMLVVIFVICYGEKSRIHRKVHIEIPTMQDYESQPQAEGRSIIEINSSDESGEQPGLSGANDNTSVIPCNSTFTLKQYGEEFYVQSEFFGRSGKQYSPNTFCQWTIKGVNKKCIPQVRCNKVDLRLVAGEYLRLRDMAAGDETFIAGDHFHDPKTGSRAGLEILFKTSPSKRFRRHFDGFRCRVTCFPPCADKIEGTRCLEFPPAQKGCPAFGDKSCQEEPVLTVTSSKDPKVRCQPVVVVPLSPHEGRNITLKFDVTEPPLDFLFIMDVSTSFSDDKIILVQRAKAIVDSLRTLSSNLAVGIGLFVDKTWRAKPAERNIDDFEFRIHMTLTTDAPTLDNFTDTVSMIQIRETQHNTDFPEDLLTALHEAAVCESKVGWRDNSRRIILIATDDYYFSSGTLASAKKFDGGVCHLDHDNKFLQNDIDYPAEAQVVASLREHRVSVVIAVTQAILPRYIPLVNQLSPLSTIAVLSADSSNIVDLLKSQVAQIRSAVVLDHEPLPELRINVYSNCSGEVKLGNSCPNNGTGMVTYIVETDLIRCPDDEPNWNKTSVFRLLGLPSAVEFRYTFLCVKD